jgi:hypothetical protein
MRISQGRATRIGSWLSAVLVVVFTVLSLLVHDTGHAAGSAFVRVNQVGYITGETKQETLAASKSPSKVSSMTCITS